MYPLGTYFFLIGINFLHLQIPRRLLQREMPMIPHLSYSIGDVRDIAKAHITALTALKAPGN